MAGRRGRRNLWPRRIITTTGLVLILVGLAFGVAHLVPVVRGFFATRAQTVAAPQSTPVRIEACRSADLRVTLAANPDAVGVGAGTVFAYTVRTRTPCASAAGAFGVVVTSGDQRVWDSEACRSGRSATPLLLDASAGWSASVRWDGRARLGCEAQAGVARAGTYRAQLAVDGQAVGPIVVLDVRD